MELKYNDDKDKCYGVAGMAISAFMLDFEDYIESVSIDRKDLESVEFTPDFYISAGDSISAKQIWKYYVNRYQIASALLISNVMSRSMVLHRQEVAYDIHNKMVDALKDFAAEDCQLETDEALTLFDKHYQYLDRAYHNSRLHDVIEKLTDELNSRRTLSHSELCDLLSGL